MADEPQPAGELPDVVLRCDLPHHVDRDARCNRDRDPGGCAGMQCQRSDLEPAAHRAGRSTRLARAVSPRVLRQARPLDDVRRQLDEYLAGTRQAFDLEVDLALATPFQRLVLTDLPTHTSYGATTTYGTVAADIDKPKAARAVGTALGANPVCVVLPCHRVVGANGALTGYAGGLDAKRFLLNLEAKR